MVDSGLSLMPVREPRDEEFKFAKRTHLNHVQSGACIFRHERNSVEKVMLGLEEAQHFTVMSIARTCEMHRATD